MKIGIYGGTFDPPHIGHINAAKTACSALKLDRLIFIPSAVPPNTSKTDNASASERLNMARLAAEYVDNAEASDIEINRGGRSYTSDTVGELRAIYPDGEFYLILGTDMAESIEKWRGFSKLVSECTLAVTVRRDGDISSVKKLLRRYENQYSAKTVLFGTDAVAVSSTEIRALLCERKGREFLADTVYAYIIKNRLYGAKPDFSWLRERAYAMLKPKRIPHVMGCEEEAVRLAERWGADADEAREAGILHDITKKEDLDGQLIFCQKYGIITDEEERKSSALLHSKTGAAVAKYEFGCPESVVNAIKWHTTGKENMTLLEKIIYLADFIEPTRSFDGLDFVRSLAYEDLDQALIRAFTLSLEDMSERGIVPHRNTVSALKYLAQHSTISASDI